MVQFDWPDLSEGQLWFVAQILLSCLSILHSFKSLVPLISYGWWSTYLKFHISCSVDFFHQRPLFHDNLGQLLKIYCSLAWWLDDYIPIFSLSLTRSFPLMNGFSIQDLFCSGLHSFWDAFFFNIIICSSDAFFWTNTIIVPDASMISYTFNEWLWTTVSDVALFISCINTCMNMLI